MMTLPKYLEGVIKDASMAMPTADWNAFRTHLTGPSCGLEAALVNKNADQIWQLKRDTNQTTNPISIPNSGMPLTPQSEASLLQIRSHSSSLDSQGQSTSEVWFTRFWCRGAPANTKFP
jgi:hypothetical protein